MKDRPGEQLRGGDYEKNDGTGGAGVVNDLANNFFNTSQRKAGAIFTTDPKDENKQSQFGVCLRRDLTKTFYGYFGQVSSGFGVLQEASRHIQEGVYIHNCGIMIPFPE